MTQLIAFFLSIGLAFGALAHECLVCGMEVKPAARTAFESIQEKKPVHFCSLSCARAFHTKYPATPVTAHDYETGDSIDAKAAYFLIKSEKIVKEMGFGMAPMVVAFSKEAAAKKKQAALKEGEVVKGYDELTQHLP